MLCGDIVGENKCGKWDRWKIEDDLLSVLYSPRGIIDPFNIHPNYTWHHPCPPGSHLASYIFIHPSVPVFFEKSTHTKLSKKVV